MVCSVRRRRQCIVHVLRVRRSNLAFFALFASQLSIPSGLGGKQGLMENRVVVVPPTTIVTKTFVRGGGG